jgi:2-keto-4-pentenoate hydratase/2-oxohepta-3-ene-1,7-dioic acid hydratase in catechol pathway
VKLLSFQHAGRASFGAVRGDGVVDLGRLFAGRFADLKAVLQAGEIDALREPATRAPTDLKLAAIRYLPTIPNPDKILCIGVNYAERNAEYQDASDLPRYPSVFLRTPGSLVGHGEAVQRPPESAQLDYEGEITLVIGKAGRRIRESDAHTHVAGLTIMNEGTVRDWLRHGKFNVTQGKNFNASGALGPWLVTPDETGDPCGPRQLRTLVNGEVRQDDNTQRLMFPFRRLLAYLSTFAELLPGDLIATGTPTGAGIHMNPPRFLVPGDTVTVEVEGVGVLRNPVADEAHG